MAGLALFLRRNRGFARFGLKRRGLLLALQILGAIGVVAVLGFENLLWHWIGNGVVCSSPSLPVVL